MKISVVCPFYNEASIIEKAAEGMIANLRATDLNWELIAVNDGSQDKGCELIENVFRNESRARVISYPHNEGRGHALQTGIEAATGEIIVTTEIDLSWGDTVVVDIVREFEQRPFLDVVIASPNLPGGGYRNVPARRVSISKAGNLIIRTLFTKTITMNTGMTRGYRAGVIQGLRIDEKGKEFHLEVLLKLFIFGSRIGEIPATLEWKDHKLAAAGSQKRKSSSNIGHLIITHLNFAVFANPIRYLWSFSAICMAGAAVFLIAAIQNLWAGEVAIYLALVSMFLGIFGLLFFGFGVITTQNVKILKELWRNPPR